MTISQYKDVLKSKLLVGVLLLHITAVSLLAYGNHPVSYSQPITVPSHVAIAKQIIQGLPSRIIISSLNVNLPVTRGEYNPSDASWTLGDDQAFYAAPTAPMNEQQGNVLIYGHNNWTAFAALPAITPGTEVEVVTTNDNHFFYTYESAASLNPNDTSVFTYQGPPVLTLQTCTGTFYQNRTQWRFKLTRVAPHVNVAEVERQAATKAVINKVSSPVNTSTSPADYNPLTHLK